MKGPLRDDLSKDHKFSIKGTNLSEVKKEFDLPYELKVLEFTGKIIVRKQAKNREGSLEHIYKNHKNEIDKDKLYGYKINITIESFDECSKGRAEYKYELKKYLYDSYSKSGTLYECWFKVVIEKENDSQNFTIITAHPYKIKKE